MGVWLLIFQAASRRLNLGCVLPRDDLQCAQNSWLFSPPLNSKVKGIKLSQGEVLAQKKQCYSTRTCQDFELLCICLTLYGH